ncbi:endonuclease NucS [Natranaerobius thermophilus]|uniref:DUF91 domain-containing protein n=1 Tax=Natranaerobius thermophilus (strain ATCC BAA-1301 / DSM 18059 / JW/NM-WN-LF) TaxID=457570 RepID=B2A5D4_NATTJ|nr:endonuclease NucS [Natranaerobius thermophilus]ACB83968.1 hypothetical protein Nther_0372 [Natranaerobius thermophilus JW/NM-WN-LF]
MPLYKVSSSDIFKMIPQRDFAKESYERKLEHWIIKNPTIITEGENILFIKQEEPLEKSEDLLGIDEQGNLLVIELKRGRTPREVIAQALEYAARVSRMDYDKLNNIAKKHFKKYDIKYSDLFEAYCDYFGKNSDKDKFSLQINQRQRIFIVAQDISEDVLSTADYLKKFDIDIQCVSFNYYNEGDLTVVDIDPDVRSSFDEPRVSAPSIESSDTEKFLKEVREQILDLYYDHISYATKKPNRVLSFQLESSKFSIGIKLEDSGELKLGASIQFEDLDMNEKICEALSDKIKKQNEDILIEDQKDKKDIKELLEWNSDLLQDDEFLGKVIDHTKTWIETWVEEINV